MCLFIPQPGSETQDLTQPVKGEVISLRLFLEAATAGETVHSLSPSWVSLEFRAHPSCACSFQRWTGREREGDRERERWCWEEPALHSDASWKEQSTTSFISKVRDRKSWRQVSRITSFHEFQWVIKSKKQAVEVGEYSSYVQHDF